MLHISEALIEQSKYFRSIQDDLMKIVSCATAEFMEPTFSEDSVKLLSSSSNTTSATLSFTDDEDLSSASSMSNVSTAANEIEELSGTSGGGTVTGDDTDENGSTKRSILETLLHTHKQQDECRQLDEKISNNNIINNLNNNNNEISEDCGRQPLNSPAILRENALDDVDSTKPTEIVCDTTTSAIMTPPPLIENISKTVDVQLLLEPNAIIEHSVDLNENNSITGTCENSTSSDKTSSGRRLDNVSQSDLIVFENDDDGLVDDDVREVRDDNDDTVNSVEQNDLGKQVQIESSNNLINQSDDVLKEEEPVSDVFENAVEAMDHNVIDNIRSLESSESAVHEETTKEPLEVSKTPPTPVEAQFGDSNSTTAIIITGSTSSDVTGIVTSTSSMPATTSVEEISLTTENLKTLEHNSASVCQLSKSLDASDSNDHQLNHSNLHHHLNRQYNQSVLESAPERSFSLESLNSETSVDSNDSKSSLKLAEIKFSKNGTLERQQQQAANSVISPVPHSQQTGLQVLVLWNNRITRSSASPISKLVAATTTLDILNVGRNVLSNEFLSNVKQSLKANTSLTSLGLQGAHLTCAGIKTLAEILEFGGNATLQRIDVRDNHLQVAGLTALNDVLKSNKTVTRVDLDDLPRRAYVSMCKVQMS